MKRALVLVLLTQLLCGCGDAIRSIVGTPTPTPVPVVATPTPKPTPKPGDWMWKEYKNPLDKNPLGPKPKK